MINQVKICCESFFFSSIPIDRPVMFLCLGSPSAGFRCFVSTQAFDYYKECSQTSSSLNSFRHLVWNGQDGFVSAAWIMKRTVPLNRVCLRGILGSDGSGFFWCVFFPPFLSCFVFFCSVLLAVDSLPSRFLFASFILSLLYMFPSPLSKSSCYKW